MIYSACDWLPTHNPSIHWSVDHPTMIPGVHRTQHLDFLLPLFFLFFTPFANGITLSISFVCYIVVSIKMSPLSNSEKKNSERSNFSLHMIDVQRKCMLEKGKRRYGCQSLHIVFLSEVERTKKKFLSR